MSNNIRRPNKTVYRFAIALTSLLFRKIYRLRIQKSSEAAMLNPPYVVIANHISNIDFLIVANAMWPRHVNFVVAAFFFRQRFLNALLTFMGCVSKEQFHPDAQAIKNIFKLVNRGSVVGLYPAGQSTFSGEGTRVDASIAPLLKKLRVPVVNVHINGAFIACPKWNMRLRKSRIEANVDLLFTIDALDSLTNEEIYQKVNSALYFDDYEWQRKALVKASKPHIAVGLERVLYMCPKCKAEFTMRTQKNRLYCSSCNNTALMNEYGLLQPANDSCVVFETPTQWEHWLHCKYSEQVAAPDFAYSEPALLKKIGRYGEYKPVGVGTASIDLGALHYNGTYNNLQVSWSLKNSTSAMLAHEKSGHFDFSYNGEMFSIAPKNSLAAFKFVALRELIYSRYYDKTRSEILD